uniref:tRNA (Mo5U34)-methyltransferase n=1 Tax=Anthurium amnicola TaxID=1678845 RepID=A0A1D1XXS6_9ARAE
MPLPDPSECRTRPPPRGGCCHPIRLPPQQMKAREGSLFPVLWRRGHAHGSGPEGVTRQLQDGGIGAASVVVAVKLPGEQNLHDPECRRLDVVLVNMRPKAVESSESHSGQLATVSMSDLKGASTLDSLLAISLC